MHLNKQTKAFVSPAPLSSAFEMVFSVFPGTLALLPHHLSSLFFSFQNLPFWSIPRCHRSPLWQRTAATVRRLCAHRAGLQQPRRKGCSPPELQPTKKGSRRHSVGPEGRAARPRCLCVPSPAAQSPGDPELLPATAPAARWGRNPAS